MDSKNKNYKIKVPKTKKEKLKNKHIILLSVILLLLITLISLIIISKNINNKPSVKDDSKVVENLEVNEQDNIREDIKIYNIESNERPIAVMISNDSVAMKRQYGIQKAYLVYEIIVEGGISRLMAIFKDVDVEKVGPVRSSRHYFLDYALENDAIYTHYGWSTYAQNDISTLKINNLNGIYNPSNMFWRHTSYSSPNNAYTSIENIKKATDSKNYRKESDNYELLNYKKTVDLTNDDTFISANNIKINYSGGHTVKYVYDSEQKYYLKYNNDNKSIDLETNKQINVKNIIVIHVENKTIPNDAYGCQELYNIGTGEGYYITDGGAIKITWSKNERSSKTVYKNLKGEVININDGNTFIQIQPKNKSLTIE